MKYLNHICYFLGFISLLFISSCDESKLDLINPNNLSPETFLKSKAQVESAVNSTYANLQAHGLYTRNIFFMMDNLSQENAANSALESDKRQYLEFTFDPSHTQMGWYWDACYRGINKCNFVLDNETSIRNITTISTEDANNLIGQAKFMRSLYYFYLVTRYGDIPLLTEVPKNGDGTPKSPASAIYTQVVTDLTSAATLLPSKHGTDLGRANSGSANALLGKVLLYSKDYAAAKIAFDKVTGYSLSETYSDNFEEETEFNEESIFEVSYDLSIGGSLSWTQSGDGSGLAEATLRAQEYGMKNWNNVYPSNELVAEFETNDPRIAGSFYSIGDFYNNGTQIVDSTIFAPGSVQQIGWRKYQNYYKKTTETGLVSGINFRVIRYADVLLMQAEVENELGNSAVAIDYLNEVRDRVNMPNYGTTEMNGAFPVTSKTEIFTAIVHERMVELSGEQIRFSDLIRWDMAESYINSITPGRFKAGKHELLPIPQTEIDANNALTNADQNSGY